ncbi:MAG: MFS transporter, partial [Burkholderiales bacterium]
MLLLAATTFAAASGIHYQTPMLGAMADEFGVDSAAIGWIPTMSFGGFLAGIAFLVPLGDRLDKRRLIISQHFCTIGALVAMGFAPSLTIAAACSF